MSTWSWSNLASGVLKVDSGVSVARCSEMQSVAEFPEGQGEQESGES